MLLGRDAIIKAEDLTFEDVEVTEWGGTVRVRMMKGSERDAFEQDLFDQKTDNPVKNLTNLRAKLVARCACNEKNERIFSDRDIPLLGEKSAAALDKVFAIAQKLNRIGQKDVEELTKNFGGEENVDSTSLSPKNSDAQ